jgi:hypothetical protein
MRITSTERLQPFSHNPGIYFILPRTNLRFQIFPTMLRIHDLSNKEPINVTDITIGIHGPVHNFTAMQDLEKGELKVWGQSSKGYFRYRIAAIENSSPKAVQFAITVEKQPPESEISWNCSQGYQKTIIKQEHDTKKTLLFSKYLDKPQTITLLIPQRNERLSLGNQKAQDWDKIKQRTNMSEIFPIWMRLGQITPSVQYSSSSGTVALLDICHSTIKQHVIETILPAFHNLFLAGFDPGLSPRLLDEQHHGFQLPPIPNQEQISPLFLLTEGAALIRQLFIRSDNSRIDILPSLPPDFHSGRFLNANTAVGRLDMEWTKKVIRRMIFTATLETELLFSFQKDVKQFRLRQKESERGAFIPSNAPIQVSCGETYLFDCFQK